MSAATETDGKINGHPRAEVDAARVAVEAYMREAPGANDERNQVLRDRVHKAAAALALRSAVTGDDAAFDPIGCAALVVIAIVASDTCVRGLLALPLPLPARAVCDDVLTATEAALEWGLERLSPAKPEGGAA